MFLLSRNNNAHNRAHGGTGRKDALAGWVMGADVIHKGNTIMPCRESNVFLACRLWIASSPLDLLT